MHHNSFFLRVCTHCSVIVEIDPSVIVQRIAVRVSSINQEYIIGRERESILLCKRIADN